MLISIIVAMAQNRVIGRDGDMPWHLPADLQRFKQITMGQTLLMGRKTYQSIGRPLPGRKTIILSRNPGFSVAGCRVVSTLVEGISACQTEQLFICGGEEVFRQALQLAEKIYLTELLQEVEGDTFFPQLPTGHFHASHSEELVDNDQPCRYSILEKITTRA
ncbi:dihydrofolate reductase [Malonomonas rubra DSM 5091]|uniref:Dihydrofolate reductase n=1 Tax=Malonomonas rubra DSM 5091 TaxID=1122189 RepID=A0A1M6G6C4_MALRU|nr:dihydrofolate reductase [Malonomonas rubra]SHJ05494.1 dihydrofolate reductase [Malonomonas rubra DSM 5091]